MRVRQFRTVLAAGSAAIMAAGLLAGSVPAASAASSARGVKPPTPAGVQLPDVVSQTPETWTPNVFAGGNGCDSQWFGHKSCHSTVYSTAVVNGEVVVAGAFTQACQPGPKSDGYCTPGTLVTRDDIFAYQLGTGTIDPDFAPVLDQGPVYSVIAGPGDTVYIGGAFTTVNGVSSDGVAALNVTPATSSTDGQLAGGFASPLQGPVRSLAYNASDGNSLYVGGSFTIPLGGKAKEKGIARLNATTGANDTSFSFTLGDPVENTTLEVEPMSLTPDGSTLAIAGTFQTVDGQSRPRVALIDTGGALGATATLADWAAPILANNCSAEHDYVRALDFSPDGSFFVIATTGYESGGGASVCDATARFPTAATGTDIQPAWINYTGGDSFYAVAVTGPVVYVAGHNRWVNNECGDNAVCEANALLVNGVAALDTNTGLALPWWHPNTSRGRGVTSLTPFTGSFDGADGGLLLGTDVDSIGGSYHSEEALFPLTTTSTPTPGGPIQSGIFSQGRLSGTDESDSGTAAMCVDDAGDGTSPGTAVQLSTCLNDAEQNWIIEPGGQIEINGMCLDTAGEATMSGTLTVLDTCNGSSTQVWTQEAGDTLVNKASAMCLDDPNASTADPTQLQIYPCDGDIQQVWPLPVAQAPPPPPPVGEVSEAQEQANTQVPCLNDAGNRAKAGNKVDVGTCLGTPSENWTMEANGTFEINGMCLDTAGGGISQGTLTVLDTCNGSSTQIWTPGSNYSLVNQASGMCLDDPGFNTANGTQLQIYSCNQGANQQWRLPAV